MTEISAPDDGRRRQSAEARRERRLVVERRDRDARRPRECRRILGVAQILWSLAPRGGDQDDLVDPLHRRRGGRSREDERQRRDEEAQEPQPSLASRPRHPSSITCPGAGNRPGRGGIRHRGVQHRRRRADRARDGRGALSQSACDSAADEQRQHEQGCNNERPHHRRPTYRRGTPETVFGRGPIRRLMVEDRTRAPRRLSPRGSTRHGSRPRICRPGETFSERGRVQWARNPARRPAARSLLEAVPSSEVS